MPRTTPDVLKVLLELLSSDRNILESLIRKQLDGKSLWADFEDDESGVSEAVTNTDHALTEQAELEEKRQLAQDAEFRMWQAFTEANLENHISRPDFEREACKAYPHWGLKEFPGHG